MGDKVTEDSDVYQRQGLGARMGFGKRPALLVIDFINGFNDPDAFGGGNIQALKKPGGKPAKKGN